MGRKALVFIAALAAGAVVAAPALAAAIPTNTSQPTITGTPVQGKTLTATNGTWTNHPTSYVYQWQRCSAAGTGCADISGATSKTYTLAAADVSHKVRVIVTAKNNDGHGTALSAPTKVIASGSPPKNSAMPTITGTPQVGEQLTASNGSWSGGVPTFSYQWQGCDSGGGSCADISGATGKTYNVRGVDAGREIRVKVTARNAAGATTAASDPTVVVELPPGSTVTTTVPSPPPHVNHRPTIHWVSAKVINGRVYARYRVCDDSRKRLTVIERDSKTGVSSYTRHWSKTPKTCATYRRNWRPASRFTGHFVVTLQARDYAGLTSSRTSRTLSR